MKTLWWLSLTSIIGVEALIPSAGKSIPLGLKPYLRNAPRKSARASLRCSSSAIHSPKIIIAGAPASGKGTQCELIKEKFGVVHLSTGDMLRAAVEEGTEVGKEAGGYMDRGELVPDEVVIGVVKERLEQADCKECGWLLDGFPRTADQALALEEVVGKPDAFVLLDVPDGLLVKRVVGRRTDFMTGKIYHLDFNPPPEGDEEVASRLVQRSDDTAEKIEKRVKAFRDNCEAVKGFYEKESVLVNGDQPKENVFLDLCAALDSLLPKGDDASSAPIEEAEKEPAAAAASMAVSDEVAAKVVQPTPAEVIMQGIKDKAVSANKKLKDEEPNEKDVSRAVEAIKEGAKDPITPFRTAKSLAIFIIMDTVLRRVLTRMGVTFPSSLFGMFTVLAVLLGIDRVNPKLASGVEMVLTPGSTLLAKWLATFFVPGLVVLPLLALPGAGDLGRLVFLTVAGWAFSVASTARIAELASAKDAIYATDVETVAPPKPNPPFTAALRSTLLTSTTLLGLASIFLTRRGLSMAPPVRSLFALTSTLLAFVHGSLQSPQFKAWCHPLISCTLGALFALKGMAVGTGMSMTSLLQQYATKGAAGSIPGGGDVLLFLLGPSVISFALPMFKNRELVKQNRNQVAATVISASVLGLGVTAVMARLIGLSEAFRLPTISRQITSPLAMSVAEMMGADKSFAVAMVVVTGLLGASMGSRLLDMLKVESPVTRGLTMGASAHGLGTAALAASEPQAFPFAAISMALTGALTTALVSLGPVKVLLKKLAGL